MRFIFILMFCCPAFADTYVTLGGWSIHPFDSCGEKTGNSCKYNSNHKIFAIESHGFTLGTFKNSYSDQSNFAGYTFRHNNFSLVSAFATGYDDEKKCSAKVGSFCPVLSISYSMPYTKFSIMGTALAVSFELKLL